MMHGLKSTVSCILCVILMLFLCSCGTSKEGTVGTPANPMEKEGYTLIFQDEFDGISLDSNKWLGQYFPHATSTLSGSATTYTVKDGILNLMISKDTPTYDDNTTMKVSSIQSWEKNLLHPGAGDNLTPVAPFEGFATQYGYFEMRARLPDCGGGGHAAWWMVGTQDDALPDGSMSTQTAEIDIFEVLLEYPNVFNITLHSWTDEAIGNWTRSVGLEDSFDDSYHIYAMDWTPAGMTFYVDGEEIAHTDQSPEYKMCMFIGLYTGCDWSGADNGVYPKTFSIDYVRVYHDNNGYPDGYTRPATATAQE